MQQLPILVVMIVIQQSSDHLSGVLENAKLPRGYEQVDSNLPHRFQLVGHMTHCTFLNKMSAVESSVTGTRSTSSPARQTRNSTIGRDCHPTVETAYPDFFFKASWPEDSRPKEADLISQARTRVTLLDAKNHEFVLRHIPTVFAADYTCGSSTAIIRVILRIRTEGSRSQYWMISKRLENLTSLLHDGEGFKRAYWEIIRCKAVTHDYFLVLNLLSGHRLLWVTGIAHGDISFNNLMYDPKSKCGILNDFDLASFIEPGTTTPQHVGHHRTGTKAFMALEMLRHSAISGYMSQHYRHELEAFAWVLLYAATISTDDLNTTGKNTFSKWHSSTYDKIYEGKAGLLSHNFRCIGNLIPKDFPHINATMNTMRMCMCIRNEGFYFDLLTSLWHLRTLKYTLIYFSKKSSRTFKFYLRNHFNGK